MEATLSTRQIISDNINRFMEARGKNRKDVCADLDFKYTTFCDWANGKTYPRVEALEKMAAYFSVQVGDFFIDLQNPPESESRIMNYMARVSEIDIDTLCKLPEDIAEKLIKSGIKIKRKSLEEYIAEAGGSLVPSEETDWGPLTGETGW